jgi:hypothetical protein
MHLLKIAAEIVLGIFLFDAALISLVYVAAGKRESLRCGRCEMCRLPETKRAA